ncbi:hypothetical protein K523DRAFT_395702 [Schizophyllum commune Tattone D]|nr:hypothetical protein K523DRAFT_395702 [Schizophyllum commune Tattone D]
MKNCDELLFLPEFAIARLPNSALFLRPGFSSANLAPKMDFEIVRGASVPFLPADPLTATFTAFLDAHYCEAFPCVSPCITFSAVADKIVRKPYAVRMRVPQELVDKIVSNLAHETDLEIFVRLLEASPSLFSPQISKILPDLPVVLQRKRHYHALQDVTELCRETMIPSVRHVAVQLPKPLGSYNCENVLLPSVLEGCTDLRSLSFDLSGMPWSKATGSAAYCRLSEVIQFSALDSLSLSRIRFKKSDIDVFSALVLPGSSRVLRLHQVEVASSLYRARLGATLPDSDLQKPSLASLTLDEPSLGFARIFTDALFPCTSECLRSVDYSPVSWVGHLQLRDLLRATPCLQHLTLRKGDDNTNYTSDHDLWLCASLRSLCICFEKPAGFDTVPSVLRTLQTIPETAPFEMLTFAIPATGTFKKGGWGALEDALLRRRSLRTMEMLFTPYKDIALSEGKKRGYVKVVNGLMPRLHEQGKPRVIVGEGEPRFNDHVDALSTADTSTRHILVVGG